MEMQNMNIKIIEMLEKWDPLGYGEDAYQTEIVDVLQALHEYEEPLTLAKTIQEIYEFSFEEIIPLVHCEKMAVNLLMIKNNSVCEL